jgi:hypothetical protein
MPCVLRAVGQCFDPHAFLRDSTLTASPVYLRGELKRPDRPGGARWPSSGFHVDVSDVDFTDLQGQIQEAIQFLEANETDLRRLVHFPGVEHVCLDFGIDRRDVFVQTDRFPPTLLSLAGALDMELELSQYSVADDED